MSKQEELVSKISLNFDTFVTQTMNFTMKCSKLLLRAFICTFWEF